VAASAAAEGRGGSVDAATLRLGAPGAAGQKQPSRYILPASPGGRTVAERGRYLENFTWGGAWSAGYQAMARRWMLHAIILAGLGILVPLAVQMAVFGTSMGLFSFAAIGRSSREAV